MARYGSGDKGRFGPSASECRLRLSVAAIVTMAWGCDAEHSMQAGSPADVQTMVLSETPVLSIGMDEGREGHQLFGVVGALRRRGGGAVVANGGTKEIRFFDAGGDLVRTLGGDGAGPGEYRLIRSAMRLAGDSMALWDPALYRLTILDPEGEVVEVRRLAAGLEIQLGGQPVSAFPTDMYAFRDGSVIAEPGFSSQVLVRGADGIRRDTVPLLFYDQNGRMARLLGPFAGTEWYVKDGSSMPMPYGYRLLVSVAGEEAFVGTGKGPIDVFTRDGVQLRSLEVPFPDVPVSEAAFDAMKEHVGARIWAPDRARTVDMVAGMPKPEYRPSYAGIATSVEGDLWVREYREPGDSVQRWIALDPNGTPRFQVTFDRAYELLDRGRDFVLVLFRDEYDVERIRLYGLRPDA